MGKQRYTAAEVSAALTANKGMVFLTAKQLGCDPDTVENYCKRYPTVQAAKEAERGQLVDEAELRLWAAVRRDEPWAISFTLKTLGRHRGYSERVNLHLVIERAAALVAGQFDLTAQEVLAEAQLLLQEIDYGM